MTNEHTNCTDCPVTAGTHKPADAVHTEIAEPGSNDLYAAILRLPCRKPTLMAERSPENAYALGHRDARHAAAELAATQGACNPPCNQAAAPVLQPLTDEQIDALWGGENVSVPQLVNRRSISRSIERAHGIGVAT